jgi:cysteine desulfurase/selenocysteine lyase
MRNIRNDFPLLTNRPDITYLDSACTSLKPMKVIDAEMSYYKEFGACGGRSSHSLGRKTSDKVEQARDNVARFVGADAEGLVWTRNTTEGLNLVANALDFSGRRKVVTTAMEHHSVLLPFMKLRDEGRIELIIIPMDSPGEISIASWARGIDRDTALVVTNSGTNTTGIRQDIAAITRLAHDNGALVCVDGAQGVPHNKTDMKKEGYDFLCFSGHQMLGPTGIGAMAARKEHISRLKKFIVGGGTVRTVSGGRPVYMEDNTSFEGGVQNYAGIIGFLAACDYLRQLGMENVEEHERALAKAMLSELGSAGAAVLGPVTAKKAALYSFNLQKAKPHDVALLLDQMGIAVRSGFFCAQPAMEAMGAKGGAVRASAYVYNTLEDVRRFGEALMKAKSLYE